MASSLKNVSLLLSPKFLPPLSSPSRNWVNVNLPKSDGKMYFRSKFRPSNIVKKLDFSQANRNSSTPLNFFHKTKIPDIKIDSAIDVIRATFDPKPSGSNNNILDINTPNKLDLVQHGLEHFRKSTTVLGKGTFGTVFKGKYKGDTVAVKLVTSESILRERNALSLIHKNIVRTLEIIRSSEQQNYNLIIMEYLPNCRSLHQVLETFSMDPVKGNQANLSKRFAIGVTTGLDYLHRSGVIHLDLKPKNILVDADYVCKICDFGNSVAIGEEFSNFNHNGTIIYTAPEILLGKEPTIKSDIYSLGLIFWQLRYRRTPFQEYETTESIIYNIGKHDVRPAFTSESPDALQGIFTKCWDSRPESRPTTANILYELKSVQF